MKKQKERSESDRRIREQETMLAEKRPSDPGGETSGAPKALR
jgi:hypothetical protein